MKETIEKLRAEMDEYSKKAGELHAAIEALQKICKHSYRDDGHDSHKRYYKCYICGAEYYE